MYTLSVVYATTNYGGKLSENCLTVKIWLKFHEIYYIFHDVSRCT